MASFVSSKDLAAVRDEKRRARKKLLDEEENKFLAKQEAKRRHKESGNDRWMLPGIEKRLQTDAAKLSEVSSRKKHKKSKKKKKKKQSSSEDSGSDSDEKWEERSGPAEKPIESTKEPTNWLNFDDIVGSNKTYTSKSIKEQKAAEKAALQEKEEDLVGTHPRELNPYWKDGGEGLPSQEKKSESKPNKIHKEWLLKSLKRMTEQAQEQGKTIESIAAERYGSWHEFQSLLRQAEPERSKDRGYKRRQDDTKKSSMGFMRPRDGDDNYSHHSHKDRKQDDIKKSGFMRPRDDDDGSSHRSHRDRKRDRDRKEKRDHRPSWKRSKADSPEDDTRSHRRSSSPRNRSPDRPSWKKNREKYTRDDKESRRKSPDRPSWKNSRDEPSKDGTESCKTKRRSPERSSKKSDSPNRDSKSPPKRILGPKGPPVTPPPLAQAKAETAIKSHEPSNSTLKNIPEPVDKSKPTSEPKPVILSEKEKNQLAAKILKAELMGNEKLAKTLKAKLERAREAENDAKETPKVASKPAQVQHESSSESEEETIVLTRVGKDGQAWPLQHSDMAYDSVPNKKRKKKTKLPTHDKDGERERYFADDDRHSLEDLVRREKTQEAEDQHAMFSRLASKQFQGTDSEYFTLDDMYVSEASQKNTRTEEEARQKQKAISEHKKLSRRLEKCRLCFGNPELPKHLLIAIGKKCYLALPDHKPLTEGHCIIVPMHHCNTGTGIDEDVWDEIRHFMRSLLAMFKSQDLDCIFMQTCIGLKKSRHFFIDCVPLPNEEGDVAPIYFKKAIQESESEWSHNKKLIDARGKSIQNCIPKGLPYFSVEFGMDGGFAHVVEDEALFPFYFGREIVGGMLDVEPRLWRHPPKDHFSEQTKRSVKFSEWWKPHDWTSEISGTT